MAETTVTIREVAERAGVSVATVSRVVSGKGHVREETRARVKAAVQELGYRPSRMARSFRAQRSSFVGLLISDIENPFHTSLARAIEDLLYARGYSLLLCNTDEVLDRERTYLQFLADERAAGVICAPASESETSFHAVLAAGIPVVCVDRVARRTPVDSVRVNNVAAMRALTQHLLERGHQRIGFVGLDTTITSGRERFEAYLQTLREAGIDPDMSLVRLGKGVEAFGRQATFSLFEVSQPPTALITANNMLTLGALKALQQRGMRVPDDVALAAFDATPWLTLLTPRFVVAAQPIREMAETAVLMLMERIEGSAQPPREVLLEATLITDAVPHLTGTVRPLAYADNASNFDEKGGGA
ncbi:MAG: LacI family transcriptional regulator [Thermoflexales bacterium]|nr:LacI family transcriptional regulator [Thermoflexales bacterium]MCX7938182.1 LacI family transcriptional regulator [Thermoflexales bacterium]MDW8292908.1 LacI family DNA-binding transcriptional regulator [Anaerolineae bacterium]